MKVIVTSGGTREPLDDVRVLTNISSGKLGAMIADEFAYPKGGGSNEVVLVTTKASVKPDYVDDIDIHYINTVDELVDEMNELVPEADVVIHSMAVSDFGFDRSKPVKLSSNDALGLIAHMAATIKKNPKVIASFRLLNPKAILVGFKFEVGKTNEELIDIAKKSMERNRLDLVLANDKEEMTKTQTHMGYLIDKFGCSIQCYGKQDIAENIVSKTLRMYEDKHAEA